MSLWELARPFAPNAINSVGNQRKPWRSEAGILWLIIAAVAASDAICLHATGRMRVYFGPAIVSGFLALIAIWFVYAKLRPQHRIASLAMIFAQLIALTCAATILIYLAATSSFPLVDHYLAAADAASGFDWLALFNWIKSHPRSDASLEVIYNTSVIQIVVLLITLNVTGNIRQSREFAWLYVITLLIIIPFSWLTPAEGAWAHYQVASRTSAYYLPDFYSLRDGTMSMIDLTKANGIIQFPSFHATLGLLLIVSSRRTILFSIYLPLNILMIVSALTSGGHHLVDILAGLAIALQAMLILRRLPFEKDVDK